MGLIGAICSGVVQWILGLFGMSDAQKVGALTVKNADLKAEAKDYRNELEIKSRPAGSDDDVIDRL